MTEKDFAHQSIYITVLFFCDEKLFVSLIFKYCYNYYTFIVIIGIKDYFAHK